MVENVENLILEQLRHIRGKVDSLVEKTDIITVRL